ncbi:MAG: epoxide hydrolase N-terminal domain-containing protein, partial [Pyrinomonadaceae bacterium]
MDVQPFSINIPESTLSDLRARLAQTRWPDTIAGSDWLYGASLN